MTDDRLRVLSSGVFRLRRIATGRWSMVRSPVLVAIAAFGVSSPRYS